jgi:hypothetical protein
MPKDHNAHHYPTSEADQRKIENAFTYHPPLADQPERYEYLRDQGKDLARTMAALCPSSRELSLALTNLEQAIMWANAAIARNEAGDAAPVGAVGGPRVHDQDITGGVAFGPHGEIRPT